jgi:hypothetical protein
VPAQAGLHRVERDVSERLPELLVPFLLSRLVPPLKQVAEEFVAVIEVARVPAVHPLHARWQVRLWRFDHQVNVVAHEAVSEQMPAIARDSLAEELQVLHAVGVVAKDR